MFAWLVRNSPVLVIRRPEYAWLVRKVIGAINRILALARTDVFCESVEDTYFVAPCARRERTDLMFTTSRTTLSTAQAGRGYVGVGPNGKVEWVQDGYL